MENDKKWNTIFIINSGPVRSQGVDCCSFFNPENLTDPNDPKIKLYCVPIMYTDRDTKGITPDHGLTLTSCLMNQNLEAKLLFNHLIL